MLNNVTNGYVLPIVSKPKLAGVPLIQSGYKALQKEQALATLQNITETKFEKHTLDILYTPLWFNNKIGQPALNCPKWYKNGILFVGDLLDTKGSFCTFNELKKILS